MGYDKKIRGRPTRREEIRQFNAVDAFYAAAAGVPPRNQIPEPPKRSRVVRPSDKRPAHPSEADVNDAIHKTAREQGARLWRNNRGVAQYGNQMVRYGVGPRGASDWLGYRRLLITADMVGKNVAQFVAIEAKRPGGERRADQQAFIDNVNADGGCAGTATSAEEAKEILDRWS